MKKALITGITGQDGSYLAELLLSKGYEVHGIARRVAAEDQRTRLSRVLHLGDRITLHYGDVADYQTIWKVIAEVMPDEIYHLAAQSQVSVSFMDGFGTFRANADSTHYILSAIKALKPDTKFYFAGTSEMYGHVLAMPQDEQTPFNPVSPYGIAKLESFYLTKMYRDAYGIFACSGILFNHESPRRGHEFVTRKITLSAAAIKCGKEKELRLGNIASLRDWGFAGDYVDAMWRMLQQEKPDDYVVGTGEQHTVKEFLDVVFGTLGLDWKEYVIIDEKLKRPLEVPTLLANAAKAKRVLQWEPKVRFNELAVMMAKADYEAQCKK